MKVQLYGDEKMFVVPNGHSKEIPVIAEDTYIMVGIGSSLLELRREDGRPISGIGVTRVFLRHVRFELAGEDK